MLGFRCVVALELHHACVYVFTYTHIHIYISIYIYIYVYVYLKVDCLPMAMESPESELRDLLTCHRSVPCLHIYCAVYVSWKGRMCTNLIYMARLFEAEEGPFPWPAPTVPASVPTPPTTSSTAPVSQPAKTRRSRWSTSWQQHVSECVLSDANLKDNLERVSEHDNIHWHLPAQVTTAGGVLAHASHVITILLDLHAPMIFKVGFTHDACWRWENSLYGYKRDKGHKWEHMCILHLSEEAGTPSMLEAALIDKYKGNSDCRKASKHWPYSCT